MTVLPSKLLIFQSKSFWVLVSVSPHHLLFKPFYWTACRWCQPVKSTNSIEVLQDSGFTGSMEVHSDARIIRLKWRLVIWDELSLFFCSRKFLSAPECFIAKGVLVTSISGRGFGVKKAWNRMTNISGRFEAFPTTLLLLGYQVGQHYFNFGSC